MAPHSLSSVAVQSPEPQIHLLSGSLLSLLVSTENGIFSGKGFLGDRGTGRRDLVCGLLCNAPCPSQHIDPSQDSYQAQPFLPIPRHLALMQSFQGPCFFRAVKSSVLGGTTEIKGKSHGRAKGSNCVPYEQPGTYISLEMFNSRAILKGTVLQRPTLPASCPYP